jgi:ketosteroid isomerase-like protein
MLTVFFCAGRMRAQINKAKIAQMLERMEHDWTDAYQHKDRAALARILADDWRGQYPWGVRTKTQSLDEMMNGDTTIQAITFGPMQVRLYGETAVVMGSDEEKSAVNGKSTTGHYTWTDVWVRRDGRWQAVASQMTIVPRE